MQTKTILLDADVIIHFMKASEHFTLPNIFPKNKLVRLDVVYNELTKHKSKKQQIDNLVNFKLIELIDLPSSNLPLLKEYANLIKSGKGDGESACLAYVRFHKNILVSSNLKDIHAYCQQYNIIYLTTMDFLCEALRSGIFDEARCDNFISIVKTKGSKLPVNKMSEYICVEKKLD